MTFAAITAFVISGIFFAFSTYLLFGSLIFPDSGITFIHTLADDHHYKYFFLFLVPTTAYFIIARWTGWQYFVTS